METYKTINAKSAYKNTNKNLIYYGIKLFLKNKDFEEIQIANNNESISIRRKENLPQNINIKGFADKEK